MLYLSDSQLNMHLRHSRQFHNCVTYTSYLRNLDLSSSCPPAGIFSAIALFQEFRYAYAMEDDEHITTAGVDV